MKSSLLCVVLCACLLACSKKDEPYPLVMKKVTFRIFVSGVNPITAADTSWATIVLQAYVSTDNGNTPLRSADTVLDRRQLRLYPDSLHALQIVRNLTVLDNSKEYLYWKVLSVQEGNRRDLVAAKQDYLPSNKVANTIDVPLR